MSSDNKYAREYTVLYDRVYAIRLYFTVGFGVGRKADV